MSTPITLEDIFQIFQRSQEEADRRAAEADRRAAKWEEEFATYRAENALILKRLDKTLDGLTSRWGCFVENMVAPAVLRLLTIRDSL